jgi:hypothetical protein
VENGGKGGEEGGFDGVAGYVIETVLDEEAPAVAKLVEDSVLGVESDLQDSSVPPRNDSAARRSKATKSDSNEAPVFMWSEFLFKRVFKVGRRLRQPASDGRLAILFSRVITSIGCVSSL